MSLLAPLSFGPVVFLAPLALLGLLTLPVLWWLLRVTPPPPRDVPFPPLALLLRHLSREDQAQRTPPWLLLLRLLAAALLIVGAARPLLDAKEAAEKTGPLYLVIDDGWAAAADWDRRRAVWQALLEEAGQVGRPVVPVTTAVASEHRPALPVDARPPAEAARLLGALEPKPWGTDRAAAWTRLGEASASIGKGEVIWISDGLTDDATASEPEKQDAADPLPSFAESLATLGPLTVMTAAARESALALAAPEADGPDLVLRVMTAERQTTTGKDARDVFVRALDDSGRVLARERVVWDDEQGEEGEDTQGENTGATSGQLRFALPTELRNRLHLFRIEGQSSAAAVALTDDRWRRRPVGILSGEGSGGDQPLLSPAYYLERALAPFTEIRRGALDDLLSRDLAVLVLADPGDLAGENLRRIEDWADSGGVVLRFAGPRLAKAETPDGLLPVPLRRGDRALGGALSWEKPAALAAFPDASPFHDLKPSPEVVIQRQVLARPGVDLAAHTWARLSDGTPLVTGARSGDGWLVLFHVTANTDWSSLPLSGLFVEMLQRIVNLSAGLTNRADGPPLDPLANLDGFGRLGAPAPGAQPIAAERFTDTPIGPEAPPGFYGRGENRRARNLGDALAQPVAFGALPDGTTTTGLAAKAGDDLRGLFFGLALVLLALDFLIALVLRGLLKPLRRRAVLPALLTVVFLAQPGASDAQSLLSRDTPPEPGNKAAWALEASLEPRLAYVRTGVPARDQISEAGLLGLSEMVRNRTAAELGRPFGIDPEVDELAFFPLIYWPVTAGQAPPSTSAAQRLNAYMRNGGTILFDTGNAGGGPGGDGADNVTAELRRIAAKLDLPPLMPIPPDHVLGRSFYLMKAYPGRFADGTLWVERSGERV
ncbi:MAG: DUF4159 domain-containing protein, partial [Rhodospirillales bacterium]